MMADLPVDVIEATKTPANRLGRYVLVGIVGEGGMATVHKAWDMKLDRWVAVKFLRDKLGPTGVERFRREALIAAGLRHKNIATILDVGEAEGRSYIVMEFVEGKPFGKMSWKGDWRGAVKALRPAIDGVAYAHAKGVIHRDLKPGNLMWESEDSVFVMDFGLARSTASEGSELTATGALVGTPMFMSPEQALGHDDEVDARSDVLSLGVTLWWMLTEKPPHPGKTFMEIVVQAARDDLTPLRRVRPDLPPSLEAVVAKATATKRAARYPSAAEFGAALDRVLAEPSAAPRMGRRRIFAAAVPALVLLGAAAGILFFRREPARETPPAAVAKETPPPRKETRTTKKEDSTPKETAARTPQTENLLQKYWSAALAAQTKGDRPEALRLALRAREYGESEGLDEYIAHLKEEKESADRAAAPTTESKVKDRPPAEKNSAAAPDDAKRVAEAENDKRFEDLFAKAGDLAKSGKLPDALVAVDAALKLKPDHAGALALRRKIVADSCRKFVKDGNDFASDRKWDKSQEAYESALNLDDANAGATTGLTRMRKARAVDLVAFTRSLTCEGHRGKVTDACFSKDGDALVSASDDGTILVWDPATGKEPSVFARCPAAVKRVVFSPDGNALASCDDRMLRIWRRADHSEQGKADTLGTVTSISFSPDGRFVAVASSGHQHVLIYKVTTMEQVALYKGPEDEVVAVAFSPDGRTLASSSGGKDWKVRLYDVIKGQLSRNLEGHTAGVSGIVFDPRGKLLASIGGEKVQGSNGVEERTVHLWDVRTGKALRTFTGHSELVLTAVFSKEGDRLITAGRDGWLRFWSTSTYEQLREEKPKQGTVWRLVLSRDGRRLAVCGDDGTIRLLSAPE